MELKSDGKKYGCNHNDCGYCHKSEVNESKCIGVEKCQDKHPKEWSEVVDSESFSSYFEEEKKVTRAMSLKMALDIANEVLTGADFDNFQDYIELISSAMDLNLDYIIGGN